MNPELKAKWIAALRSGDYKQGTGDLHHSGLYCCLGVLHQVITGSTPPEAWALGERPDEITEIPLDTRKVLVCMNDVVEAPFAAIADYIEAKL